MIGIFEYMWLRIYSVFIGTLGKLLYRPIPGFQGCDPRNRDHDGIAEDGQFTTSNTAMYGALMRLIRSAKSEVIIHTCFTERGPDGQIDTFYDGLWTMLEEMVERHGIRVVVTMDGGPFGHLLMTSPNRLVPPKAFPKIEWRLMHGQLDSSYGHHLPCYHRKFVVIDRCRAFVTGANLTHCYMTDQDTPRNLRDCSWTSENEAVVSALCALHDSGRVPPGNHHVVTECAALFYQTIIPRVQTSLVLFTGVFEPDARMVENLMRLGPLVDIYCMNPARGWNISRWSFMRMIEAGVRIHVLDADHASIHMKVWVLNGQNAWIGSCNISSRSFRLDDEIMAVCPHPTKLLTWAAKACRPYAIPPDSGSVFWRGLDMFDTLVL
jgi:phosphatidylserine/phosphatidylglycerophosphate/cardiolipin synthase-like enzyme